MGNAKPSTDGPFKIGVYHVDPAQLSVAGAGGQTRLEKKVMQVLVYLAEHAGQVVSRPELEARLWPGRIVTEDAVTKLRKAFGDSARQPRFIETIPKSGYRLIAEVALSQAGVIPESAPKNVVTNATTGLENRPEKPSRRWAIGLGALVLLLIGVWVMSSRDVPPPDQDAPLKGKPAIAILPFNNLGGAAEQGYFANGITADLITDLSKVTGLLVIAPGSVFAYQGSDAGPRQISAELGVDYVVIGSVQRQGERLRVNVQLIEAADEHALWGDRYEGVIEELFAIQDTLTAAVVAALEIELAPAERSELAKRPTASIAAYDYYLRGLEHGRRSSDQNLVARAHFQKAIDLDPSFARAYAGLALTHTRDAIDGWSTNPRASFKQAVAYADKAAELDPRLPQVYWVRGQVHLFQGRHGQALEAARDALHFDPNYADAYALSAWIFNYAGRPDEARTAMQKAMRLNPRPTASYLEVLGEIRFVEGRYSESASIFETVLDINPSYTRARMWLAGVLVYAGDQERAAWEAVELLVLAPDLTLGRLAFAFPFKDSRVLDRLLEGLRRAGVPD